MRDGYMDIMQEDFKYISNNVDLSRFCGKRILVTGATGLIGQNIIEALLNWNKSSDNPIKILALVRNLDKAKAMFGEYPSNGLDYLVSDIMDLQAVNMEINFVIHGASQTSSKAFVTNPVEVINVALKGTENILKLARKNPIDGVVYLSSMEIYGSPSTDEKIYENHCTNLDTTKVRTCYPESKRMCENLCISYASEYGIPVKIVRLTQTFGAGVQYEDRRVFAEFARCVMEKKDIVLHTKGETKRSYVYTADAVSAILIILLEGNVGEAYNVANEETYYTIYEMAELVANSCAKGKICVTIEKNQDLSQFGYAPVLRMNLDTTKLKELGWKPQFDLEDMFKRMILDMKLE